MKRWFLAVPVMLVGLTAVGCGAYGGYYGGGYSYLGMAPPPPRAEIRGYAPGPGYVWVGGYWGYRGNNYYWNPGSWVRPPHRNARWEEGRWEHSSHGYYWRDGRWR
jgi:hypothetical protein